MLAHGTCGDRQQATAKPAPPSPVSVDLRRASGRWVLSVVAPRQRWPGSVRRSLPSGSRDRARGGKGALPKRHWSPIGDWVATSIWLGQASIEFEFVNHEEEEILALHS